MDKVGEEIITRSNINSAVEDIVKEHCYVEVNTKTVLFCHLIDHNYFGTDSPKPKKKPAKKTQRNRTIKITELRAVYNCKSCGYRTMDRELSAKHNCDRKPAQYVPCTKCDRHKKNKAPEGYEQCTKCSYFTKNKGSLKVHMRIHAKGTPYKCTECEFSGRDLKDLIAHFGKVRDLKCECGFTTHVKTQMVAHKRSHTGEKPFLCGVCNYSTADRAGLHRHLKKHDGVE